MKIINLAPVETTATLLITELTYRKATAIDETGDISITLSLTSIPKEGSICQITHIFISSFSHEWNLKNTAHITIDLCYSEEVNKCL